MPPSDLCSASQAERIRSLAAELARRRLEALRLYEPLPVQAAFHEGMAKTRLLRGSNRGGKTLPAAVEVARAVTAQDPYHRYPAEGGVAYAVGKDLSHIGRTMWKKLGRPGAFKIIRDRYTHRWRAFRPWDERDQARVAEAKLAPPLIPKRFVREIAWENKRESVPSVVYLTTGWEIHFFSSLGKPPQGSDIDLWWFDEEIVDADWLPELQARVLDRAGRGIWSATPQAGTLHLFDLHERAEREEALANPKVTEHVVLLVDNPHVGDEEKAEFAAGLSEEQYRVRVGGEYAVAGYLVYPEFSMIIHGTEFREIPNSWTRYAIVDPGHQVCAVLFAAIPPPEEEDHIYLYDELYIRNCNAAMFGKRMADKATGQTFEAFVMDAHLGKHTEVGFGRSVCQQYTDSLRNNRVSCNRTGSGFLWASDDVLGGISAVRELLRVRENGTPKLLVVKNACPALEWEIRRYKNQVVGSTVIDRPNQKKNNHQMDCLRYLAMFRPHYVQPTTRKAALSGAVVAFRARQKRLREASGEGDGEIIRLGPGVN